MDIELTQLITYIALGLFTLVMLVIYFFSVFTRQRDREKFRMQRELLDYEAKRNDYVQHQISRDIDRDKQYSPKIYEELVNRIDNIEFRISDGFEQLAETSMHNSEKYYVEMSDRLESVLRAVSEIYEINLDKSSDREADLSDKLDTALEVLINSETRKESRDSNAGQLIRELSHALNTPLSQIEVTTSLALSTPDENLGLNESLESIKNSVQICKAFLGAYRELAISSSVAVWNPDSIATAVESAGRVYKSKINENIAINIDLPDNIPGYSNNYITALILPLLENAIESSKEASTIRVMHTFETDKIQLLVANETDAPPQADEIYDEGFTTKEAHEGIGLASVKNLLKTIKDAGVEHSCGSNTVEFAISLPRRKE